MVPEIGVILQKIFLEEQENNVEKGKINFNKFRFHNHLDPKISKDRWTDEED